MMNSTPLAERMRPNRLEDYFGQEHLLGEGSSLRKGIESGWLPSMILWGPPGVGKTTLANLISKKLDRPFYTLSAISSGVKEVREVIQKVEKNGFFNSKGAILFIDEIHRFSKSQQDSLLGAVEKGIVTLIGATTENPSFEVISALLSRCQVYTLKEHSKTSLLQILENATENDQILKTKSIILEDVNFLFALSSGDARKLLNLFELVVNNIHDDPIIINKENIQQHAMASIANYDKDGEQHYDIISAYIKSVRGSDVNAALYWLARMIEGGEDVKFIARRLIILAAEDIGLANPNALLMANNCFQAAVNIGFPEARLVLSQCTIYLANSPKGNASYMAINKAQQKVKETGNLKVPLHLRNAPTKLMKELGYGENYQYSHDFPGNFKVQEFMPEGLEKVNFYKAGSSNKEKEVEHNVYKLWQSKYKND